MSKPTGFYHTLHQVDGERYDAFVSMRCVRSRVSETWSGRTVEWLNPENEVLAKASITDGDVTYWLIGWAL